MDRLSSHLAQALSATLSPSSPEHRSQPVIPSVVLKVLLESFIVTVESSTLMRPNERDGAADLGHLIPFSSNCVQIPPSAETVIPNI